MNVFVIGVGRSGDSLLSSPYMEKELRLLGLRVVCLSATDDIQLESALRQAAQAGGAILCPLTGKAAVDRLCVQQLAQLCGVGLAADQKAAQRIARLGRMSAQEAQELALLPQGARAFPSRTAATPGFELTGPGLAVYALPSSGEEQSGIFFSYVFPLLAKEAAPQCSSRVLRVMELSAAQVEGALRDLLPCDNPCVAVYPKSSEVIVRISVRGEDRQQASAACVSAMRTVVQRLGSYVYGVDVNSIEHALAQKVAKKGLLVAIAESGTGGMAAKRLAAAPGGSAVLAPAHSFQPESLELTQVGISDKIGKKFGPVSANVAAALALGQAKAQPAQNIGVGITLPTAQVRGAHAYVCACMGDACLLRQLPVADHPCVSALVDAAVSLALNLARRIADSYPEAPKGAVGAEEAVLQGAALLPAASSGHPAPAAAAAAPLRTGEDSPLPTQQPNPEQEEQEPDMSKKKKKKGGILSAIFPNRNDSGFDKVRKLLLILCVCVFVGAITYLVKFKTDSIQSEKNIANLQQEMDQAEKEGDAIAATIEGYPEDYLTKFASFYQRNQDIKGWIKIPNTNVNFPVVQSSDNDFYHRLNFDKEYDYYGTPYIDYECDVQAPSTNIIIYGHNIKADGQMFNDLTKYKQLDFYKENPVVNFDSVYRTGSYKIIGAMITNATPEQDNGKLFDYVSFVNANTQEEFDAYVNEVRRRSIFDAPVDVQYGDELLTLSTCTYEFRPEARFVVVARRVRDGEDATVDTSKAVINEDAYFPAAMKGGISQASAAASSEVEVTGVSVDGKKSHSLKVGETVTLTATVSPSNATYQEVTWDSSRKDVATVDKTTGVVTAVGPGEAMITAVAHGGLVANVSVNVTGTAQEGGGQSQGGQRQLSLNHSELAMQPGATGSLTASVTPSGEADGLRWSSSNQGVVQVNGSGLSAELTAVADGTATVTAATADGALSASCLINVTQDTQITAVSFPQQSLQLQAGSSHTLRLGTSPAGLSAGSVDWNWDGGSHSLTVKQGSNPMEVVLTAKSAGSGTLSAVTDEGLSASISIQISGETSQQPPAGGEVTLTLNNLTLETDSEGQMTFQVNPPGTKLVWSSSNPRVADVDGDGYITTGAPERTTNVTITAATQDGKVKQSATVTVNVAGTTAANGGGDDNGQQGHLQLSVDSLEFDIADGSYQSLDIQIQGSDDVSVQCRSDNPDIQVNNNGDITAHSAGRATITVSATDNHTGETVTAEAQVVVLGREDPEPSRDEESDSQSHEEDEWNELNENNGWEL